MHTQRRTFTKEGVVKYLVHSRYYAKYFCWTILAILKILKMANETTSAPLSVPSYCMVEFAVCREKTNLALYCECGLCIYYIVFFLYLIHCIFVLHWLVCSSICNATMSRFFAWVAFPYLVAPAIAGTELAATPILRRSSSSPLSEIHFQPIRRLD